MRDASELMEADSCQSSLEPIVSWDLGTEDSEECPD
jgi:hypothetical protein